MKLCDHWRSLVRLGDLLGRMGGEEFAVMLPGSSIAGAAEAAEDLRKSAAALEISAGGVRLHLSVSIGATEILVGDEGVDVALIRADRALYSAKGAGRNRVVAVPAGDQDRRRCAMA